MERNEAFHILEIEETKDIAKICAGYHKILKLTNPEDKPEEFKKLQVAYREAKKEILKRVIEILGENENFTY